MENKPGLLTPDQRAFLRGEKEYEHEQSETDMRYKIRTRVRRALFDFVLLVQELEPRDRKQLLKDVRAPQNRDDDEYLTDEVFRDGEPTALIYMVAFLYQAAEDVGFDFEKLVELGVVAGHDEDPTNPFAARSVEVTIDEHLEYDFERIRGKIEAGDELSEPEYLALTRLLLADLSEFVEVCQRTHVDIQGKIEAGETLTVGESVVAVGKFMGRPLRFDRDTLREHLHERVRTEIGLDSIP